MLVGKGKKLVARALVNSLAIEDARFCHAKYLDNGIASSQFFNDSIASTAHIISHIEKLTPMNESVLWRYLTNGCCNYFNFASRKYDMILHCNGLIVLTAKDIESVPESIAKAVDHTIRLEPLSVDQLEIVVHQQFRFCGIEYEGEEVLLLTSSLDSILSAKVSFGEGRIKGRDMSYGKYPSLWLKLIRLLIEERILRLEPSTNSCWSIWSAKF